MEPADSLPPHEAPVDSKKERREQQEEARERCYDACEARDIEQLREILRSTQLAKSDLESLLHCAIAEYGIEATRCLLENGADAKSGGVPYFREDTSLEMFTLLASFGMEFMSKDNVLMRFTHNREILDFLLDQGMDINQGGNLEIWEAAVPNPKGPSRPRRSFRDKTCQVLNKVAAQGDIELFDHLVSRGADPARSNALHYAVTCEDQGKSAAMIQHLIEIYRLDVNAHDGHDGLNELADMIVGEYGPWGRPLNVAIRYGNVLAIDTLLKYNADASAYVDKSI